MSATKLGLRYERLLLFTAPLTLLSALLLFLAIAASSQEDQVRARCLDAAGEALQPQIGALMQAQQKPAPKTRLDSEIRQIEYVHDLSIALIPIRIGKCGANIEAQIDRWAKLTADKIIPSMKEEATKLRAKPLELYGVAMPEKVSLSLMGNAVTLAPAALIQALQVALAPLLMLWLGSLYNTRVREVLLIKESRHLAELCPHMLNAYPSGRFPEPRRKVLFPNMFRRTCSFLYFLTRVALLVMFVGPPVCMYLYGLYLLNFEDSPIYLIASGAVIALFALSNVMVEGAPSHYAKWFQKSANQL
jgi:hypothetical protein